MISDAWTTVRPWDARFLGEKKTCAAQNSCNFCYLIRWKQNDLKTVLLKVFTINSFSSNFLGPNLKTCTCKVRAAWGSVSRGLTVHPSRPISFHNWPVEDTKSFPELVEASSTVNRIKPPQMHQGIKSQWYIPKMQLPWWMILAEACQGTFTQWIVTVEKQQQLYGISHNFKTHWKQCAVVAVLGTQKQRSMMHERIDIRYEHPVPRLSSQKKGFHLSYSNILLKSY